MPPKSEKTINNKYKLIQFMDTPKMSTYLLALIIGEFDFLQTNTNNGTLIKIFTPQNQSNNGSFSLQCAKRCLELFENWFDIN